MWLNILLAFIVIVIAGYFVMERLEQASSETFPISGPGCSSCDHWSKGIDTGKNYGAFDKLGLCGQPHKVELYNLTKYVTLVTEENYFCPKWTALEDVRSRTIIPTETSPLPFSGQDPEAEDDPIENWEDTEKLDFAVTLRRRNG